MDEPPLSAPRLSVAIIARNCAQPLRATIASIRSIADEIVVLDTGSTDDTLVAAMQAGASVHRQAWDDSFAAARNACLDHATGQWVLWLDAGETISPEHAGQLQKRLSLPGTPQHAYLVNVALPAAAGQIGGEQIARIRLHPRRADLRFSGRVRERLDDALAAAGIPLEALPLAIHRPTLDHTPAIKTAKAQRNIRLADLALAEDGPSADLHNVLGDAFQSLTDHARAAQHYRRALDLAAAGSREHLEAFYGLLTCLDGVAADRSDQLSLCMLALEHFPLDAQLLVALGGYLQSLGQINLAIRAFDVAFRHGQIEPRNWHLSEIREIAASCAAAALVQSEQDDAGRTLLEAAVRTLPESMRLAIQLLDLHVAHRRRDEALAVVSQLPLPASRERLAAAVRGACLAQQEKWAAAADLLQAAMLDGCRERFCLRWLVVSWQALGRPLDAQAALRAWLAFEPKSEEAANLSRQVAQQLDELAAVRTAPVRIDGTSVTIPTIAAPRTQTAQPAPTRGV